MDFKINSWYRLSTAASIKSQLSLAGTYPYLSGEEGVVTFGSSSNDMPAQQWQLFPAGYSTFMLRTKASGPNGYLATQATSQTNITAHIFNRTDTDPAMLWRIVPWGNGTFQFSNVANGDAWSLDFQGFKGVAMSKSTTQPQPGQAFSLVKVGDINDSAFSMVNTPSPSPVAYTSTSTTASPTMTSSASSAFIQNISSTPQPEPTFTSTTPLPSATSKRQSENGLSPMAALGVGVTIGVLAVITLTALGLFMFQRWKRHRNPETIHYRRAKLWRGFVPQRPIAPAPPTITKTASDVHIVELPVLETPSPVFSPPLSARFAERHWSWQSTHSLRIGSPPLSPYEPFTPTSPAVELPV